MPATIRLKRMGRKKQSSFRIVVAEKSDAISGPAIENLGIYQPRTEPSLVRLDAERALRWLRNGAMPSDTVKSIFRKTGLWAKYHDGVTPEELTEKEIRLGPPEGQLKTSGRARAAAAARERAETAAAADEDGAGGEETTAAGVAEEPEEGPSSPDAEADAEASPADADGEQESDEEPDATVGDEETDEGPDATAEEEDGSGPTEEEEEDGEDEDEK